MNFYDLDMFSEIYLVSKASLNLCSCYLLLYKKREKCKKLSCKSERLNVFLINLFSEPQIKGHIKKI